MALARVCPHFVKMPSIEVELQNVQCSLFSNVRFPNCLVALDWTHVKIQSTGEDNADLYRQSNK